MQPKPALPRWRIRTNLQEGPARGPHPPQVQGHRRQGRLVPERSHRQGRLEAALSGSRPGVAKASLGYSSPIPVSNR